jgi:acyl-CoA ligase (AMP-forming) (exosortase A-associated)
VDRVAGGLAELGVQPGARVLINLPTSLEVVVALFAITRIGAIAVPTNPNLAGAQLRAILADSAPSAVVSMSTRLDRLAVDLNEFSSVQALVACDGERAPKAGTHPWSELDGALPADPGGPEDIAAILYTSGSSGRAKGVVLSHENMVLGAKSVAHYLGNRADDRLLAALPLSFDAGLSQVTTALISGGTAVLHEYVFAADVARAIVEHRITGLTAVPSLWSALTRLEWVPGSGSSLRYFANTGGKLQPTLLERLRTVFPQAKPFLMYGLTEAFRSTFLPPEQAAIRPQSIGNAIPNAEVFVLREDGTPCEPFEHGEIVHVGPLVSQGYWNGATSSYARFTDAPACAGTGGRAVWSGDVGYCDEEGYLYFVSRRDEMIKVSGYRVSPAEVETAACACSGVHESCVFGVERSDGSQEIWLVASSRLPGVLALGPCEELTRTVLKELRGRLPRHAVPARVLWLESLPRDLNGKVNHHALKASFCRDDGITAS